MQGRLDALSIASFVAPLTKHIGVVPTIVPTHAEPFHIASGVSTLDYVSRGRAGWRVQIAGRAHEAAHFGRRELPVIDPSTRRPGEISEATVDLFDEAADVACLIERWNDDGDAHQVPLSHRTRRDAPE